MLGIAIRAIRIQIVRIVFALARPMIMEIAFMFPFSK